MSVYFTERHGIVYFGSLWSYIESGGDGDFCDVRLWFFNVVESISNLDYVHFVYGKLMIYLKKMEMCAQT